MSIDDIEYHSAKNDEILIQTLAQKKKVKNHWIKKSCEKKLLFIQNNSEKQINIEKVFT